MTPVSLDSLPIHSEWATALLDPETAFPEDPTAYTGTDQYEAMYAGMRTHHDTDIDRDEFLDSVYRRGGSRVVSVGERLYEMKPAELRARADATAYTAAATANHSPSTVFDLGCGYGAALQPLAAAVPDATVVGGEYSEDGVALANAIHDSDRIRATQFDFDGDWSLLDDASDGVVFTRGVMTALADPEAVADRFARLARAGTLTGGVHLEQVDVHPTTTLGLLRRRYADVRGYDGGFLDALKTAAGISVVDVEYDVLGSNPLHPHTQVRWVSE